MILPTTVYSPESKEQSTWACVLMLMVLRPPARELLGTCEKSGYSTYTNLQNGPSRKDPEISMHTAALMIPSWLDLEMSSLPTGLLWDMGPSKPDSGLLSQGSLLRCLENTLSTYMDNFVPSTSILQPTWSIP